jgi:hypothetical protein
MQTAAPAFVLLFALSAQGAIVDRIVVTVGNQVITQSEIERQTRIAAFLNGVPVDLSAASRRKTAERIIEQELIRKEARLSQYPRPEIWEAEKMMKEAREAKSMSEVQWQHALKQYGLTEAELVQHFETQLQTLRFTDYRFRPAVQISEGDLREYSAQKYKGKTAPPLEDAREALERELIDQRVDQSLDRWLKEARMQTRIEIREASFK